jgi:hypothetical protein
VAQPWLEHGLSERDAVRAWHSGQFSSIRAIFETFFGKGVGEGGKGWEGGRGVEKGTREGD